MKSWFHSKNNMLQIYLQKMSLMLFYMFILCILICPRIKCMIINNWYNHNIIVVPNADISILYLSRGLVFFIISWRWYRISWEIYTNILFYRKYYVAIYWCIYMITNILMYIHDKNINNYTLQRFCVTTKLRIFVSMYKNITLF